MNQVIGSIWIVLIFANLASSLYTSTFNQQLAIRKSLKTNDNGALQTSQRVNRQLSQAFGSDLPVIPILIGSVALVFGIFNIDNKVRVYINDV